MVVQRSAGNNKTYSYGWPCWVYKLATISVGALFALIWFDAVVEIVDGRDMHVTQQIGQEIGSHSKFATSHLGMVGKELDEISERIADYLADARSNETVLQEFDIRIAQLDAELQGIDDVKARKLRLAIRALHDMLHTNGVNPNASYSHLDSFSSPRYWEDFYNAMSDNDLHEWYGTWNSKISKVVGAHEDGHVRREVFRVRDVLRPYLSVAERILMLGCGISDISQQMYLDGYELIANVDLSDVALARMRARYSACCPKMTWSKMNASNLDLASESFNVVIDKATLDALEQSSSLLQAAVKEAHRVLLYDGIFISISSHTRMRDHMQRYATWARCDFQAFEHFDEARGTISTQTPGGSSHPLFIHICQRGMLADTDATMMPFRDVEANGARSQ